MSTGASGSGPTRRTLIVTNDFPPRQGGIETFAWQIARRFPPGEVVVFTARMRGDRAFDARVPFTVIRAATGTLLPTPWITRQVVETIWHYGCTSVWFASAAPLSVMALALSERTGVGPIVASTHGHEVGWARAPVAWRLLHRIGRDNDHLTYISEYTRAGIAPALDELSRDRLVALPPGVDVDAFAPHDEPAATRAGAMRSRLGLEGREVILCVSRLTAHKGQDTLIRAMRHVLVRHPSACAVLVGGGLRHRELARLAHHLGVQDAVRFVGGVPYDQVPAMYAGAQVFAAPLRSWSRGEGLGMVSLEAAAAGLPVIIGRSGGAPEAVIDGVTGHVVDGDDPREVAGRIVDLLDDPDRARAMGAAGRAWVEQHWSWDSRFATLTALLHHPTHSHVSGTT